MTEYIFVKLLIAHLLGDFILPPWKSMKEKGRPVVASRRLWLHAFVHLVLAAAALAGSDFWYLAFVVSLSHFAGDAIRYYWQSKYPLASLFVDQLFHVVVILMVWAVNTQVQPFMFAITVPFIELAGLLFVTKPTAVIVQAFLSRWPPAKEIEKNKGLVNAGQWIGILERILIFVFVVAGQWEAVGFLLAAKSVFRFGDLKNSKEVHLTEYILMGTLLSFTIAIFTGLIVTSIAG